MDIFLQWILIIAVSLIFISLEVIEWIRNEPNRRMKKMMANAVQPKIESSGKMIDDCPIVIDCGGD